MRFLKRLMSQRQVKRSSVLSFESLETKALMATSTAAIATGFTGVDLSGFTFRAAVLHENTSGATISKAENALQSQITSNALVALQAGTLVPADFQTSVNNIVNSYQTNIDQQLLPRFKNIDAILDGQAQTIQQTIAALNTQLTAGLITTATYTTEAAQAVNAITGGPLFPLNTPTSGLATATKALETQLNLLPPTLATGATPSLTLTQVQEVSAADTTAYSVAMNTALFTRPKLVAKVNTAITTYSASVAAITTTGTTTPAQQLTAAITALDTALLDTDGLFGPKGSVSK